jgi:hypothetical protein
VQGAELLKPVVLIRVTVEPFAPAEGITVDFFVICNDCVTVCDALKMG